MLDVPFSKPRISVAPTFWAYVGMPRLLLHQPATKWMGIGQQIPQLEHAVAAGIMAPIGNHIFRTTGIAAYLANNGTLEHAWLWLRMPARARRNYMTERMSDWRRPRWSGSDCERAGKRHDSRGRDQNG